MRAARLDRARFLREQVFVAVGDENVDPPRPPAALHGGVERLWLSHAAGADDSDADGISIPADRLGTPGGKVVVAGDGEDPGDSLAGTVPWRHPRAKVAPHADATGATPASHAGSPVWSPGVLTRSGSRSTSQPGR